MKKFASEQLNSLKPENYVFIGLWKSQIFANYFWINWRNEEALKKIGFTVPFSGTLGLNGGHFFIHKQLLEEVEVQIMESINTKDYRKFENAAKATHDLFEDLMRETDKLVSSEPDKENLEKAFHIYQQILTPWCFSNFLTTILDPLLFSYAKKEGLDESEITSVMPKVHSLLIDQQNDARRLAGLLVSSMDGDLPVGDLVEKTGAELKEMIQKDPIIHKEFQNHIEKFGWIEMLSFIGEPLTLERLIQQMRNHAEKRSTSKESAEKQANEKKQPGEKQTNEKPTAKLSQDFKDFLKALSAASYMRQAGAEYSSMFHLRLYDFLKKTASKLGITYREMLCLIPEEILDGVSGKISLTDIKNIIAKRSGDKKESDNWLIYMDVKDDTLVVLDDREDLQKLQSIMVPKEEPGNTGDLKGQVGNKGKVKGIVSVIMATDDFHKFKDGNVLVTTMTTPDFVILMQKSLAIVTDIGGLLSHAAIVSRELNIPCVIGTKFATQKLKDGDTVEVDADKGIVRIIK